MVSMPIRRLLIPVALGVFFLASALVALNLKGVQPGADGPVTASSHPAANLELTTTLNHGRLIAGRPLTVHVELRNMGSSPAPLPPDEMCIMPLRLELVDASGRVVWSQPIPMIACPAPPPGDRKQGFLNPGEVRSADACFQLDGTTGPCVLLGLPDASYRVAGTYFGFAVPQAEFRIIH
jgi:hypothetical protein